MKLIEASPKVNGSLVPRPTLSFEAIELKLIEPSASPRPPLMTVPLAQLPDVLLPLHV